MISRMTTRLLTGIGVFFAIVSASVSARTQSPAKGTAAKAPDAAVHKAWMNDAADAQDDLREALAGKSSAKSAAAALKLQTLMTRTERYWAGRHAADIVKLAQQSKAFAGQVASAARARKFEQAGDAFGKLNTTCNTCHDLHPEKR
jgi:hypothetical protein